MTEFNAYERGVFATVEEHGWHGTHVFDPEGDRPGFSYSTGFAKTLSAPEFIIFGLPRGLMHNMLWEVYRQLSDGARPEDGMAWENLLDGFACISRRAKAPELHTEYTVTASWFWSACGSSGDPVVYQMVWPGAVDGRFPWDVDCAASVIEAQTPLWAQD